MEYFIIIYKNTFDAMEAERIFNEKGFKFKIMPTPTSITQSCGICIRIESEEKIKRIIDGNIIEFKNIYKKENTEYILVK